MRLLAQRHEAITKRKGGGEERRKEYKTILDRMEEARRIEGQGRRKVKEKIEKACTESRDVLASHVIGSIFGFGSSNHPPT